MFSARENFSFFGFPENSDWMVPTMPAMES
jgi:hypothetical protein